MHSCLNQLVRASLARRASPQLTRTLATDNSAPTPWFVDQQYEHPPRQQPPHLKPAQSSTTNTAPDDAPEPVKMVHAALARSPHLDQATLVTSQTVTPRPGPPLPLKAPQGRRKRGSTYGGESMFDVPGGVWSWTVIAQVCNFLHCCS